MSKELFDSLSIFSIFIGTVAFVLISFEVGYQISKYAQSHYEGKVDTSQGPMVGGILAMLAFVLAFTFSMAASRFDDRKETVLNEANAINLAYLRADLIAQPYRTEVKSLLREYVDIRLHGLKNMEVALTRSLELHELLWGQATLAAEKNPQALNLLLIQSISEVINIHRKRKTRPFDGLGHGVGRPDAHDFGVAAVVSTCQPFGHRRIAQFLGFFGTHNTYCGS